MLSLFDSFSIRLSASWRVPRHLSLHRYQIPNPHKVIGRYRKLEYPPDLRNTAMAQLPQQSHRLQPPKYFFYSFPFPLADPIADVPRRSIIYRGLSAGVILCDVWRHISLAKLFHELSSVVALIASHRHSPAAAHLAGELNTHIALCCSSCTRDTGVGHQSVSILQKKMPGIIELCFLSFSFLAQQRVRIGRRLMRLVRPFLTVKVHRRIPRIVRRVFITVASLLETLQSCRRLNKGPVHCEVFIAEQAVSPRSLKHSGEKLLGNIALQTPFAVLTKCRRIPNVVVHTQPNEPAEQHGVVELFHQHPLASHAVQYLKEQRSKQLLGCDRRSPGIRIQLLKPWRKINEDLIHQLADRTKRMILRNSLFGRDVAELSVLMKIVSSHLFRLRCWIEVLLKCTLKPPSGYSLFELQQL